MFLRRRLLRLTLLALPCCLAGLFLFQLAWVRGNQLPIRPAQLSTPEPPLANPLPEEIRPAPVPAPLPPPPPPVPGPLVMPPAGAVVAPPAGPPPAGQPAVPVVAIRVKVPSCGVEGQELKYLVCVENTSPAPAHHVLVRAAVPVGAQLVRTEPPATTQDADLLWALGTLPGLCTKEIWLVLRPVDTDEVKLCARVQFEHGQCVCTRVARSAPPAVPLPPAIQPPTGPPMPYADERPGQAPDKEKVSPLPKGQARLDLKITGPEQVVNEPATYTITLTNPGTTAAGNAIVTATVPPGTTFVRASEGGRHVAGMVAWTLRTPLDAGASRTVEVTLKATTAGKHCVQAGALADEGLSAQAEFCTVFKLAPAVRLKMIDTTDPVAVGEETSYRIEVHSQGTLPVTNVRLKAIIPDEMTFVRSSGPQEGQKGERLKEGQVILFGPHAPLGPEETLTYEVFVKAQRPGDVRFRVELTADQLQAGGPVHEEESTMVFTDER